MSGFISRSPRTLAVIGLAGLVSTLAISNASAFGGRGGFGGGFGGGMHMSMGGGMHPMFGGGMRSSGWGMHPSMGGGMAQHFPVSTPSWIGGGSHPTGGSNCGYGGGCGSVWGSHTTTPSWGSHTTVPSWGSHTTTPSWGTGGQVASHCGWGGCGSSGHPWYPNRPWFPGHPWHPGYPVAYNTPSYTPVYSTPSYTAPTYTAPTYTAPVTYTAPTYTAPVTYSAPVTPAYTAPATYTPPAATAPVASTCPAPDVNQQYVSVTFQSNASAVDTASFLKAYNLAVQDGPSQDGSFKLRLQTALPQDQLGQMIDSMKSQTTIVSQATAG